jgi:cell division protein ZapA
VSQESEDSIPVVVRIMDKEYRIGCKDGEQEGLLLSAQYVDRNMREIRQSGRVIGADRIAVMAALNIAHELLQYRRVRDRSEEDIGERIRKLQKKIESALDTRAVS